MKSYLAVTAFVALASTAAADLQDFDLSSYTAEVALTRATLEAATGAGVTARGIKGAVAPGGNVVIFAQLPNGTGDVWLADYNPATSSVSIIGGNTVAALKGSATGLVRGSFAVGNGLAAWHDNQAFGTISTINLSTAAYGTLISDPANLNFIGSLDYLGGDLWVAGASNGNNNTPRDLYLINATAGGSYSVITTQNSMQDVAAVGPDRALIINEWNRDILDVTNIGGTATVTNINPPGFGFSAGGPAIRDLVALAPDFWAIYTDTAPARVAISNGTGTITNINIADIAAAVPGGFSPNFHNAFHFYQPDADTLHLYIGNFLNTVDDAPLVRLVWTKSASVNEWMTY